MCFYFLTSPILCTYFTLGNCQDLNISKNYTKSWKFCKNLRFWLKISICQSSMVHEGCWVNCPTRVGNLEASTVCCRESARRVQLSRNQAAVDHVQRVTVDDLVHSQDKPKKALISLWDFAWNYHSLFKCAQDNSRRSPAQTLQMTSCSAVVWSQSHLSSHSLINNLVVCNKSCYCILLNCTLNNK